MCVSDPTKRIHPMAIGKSGKRKKRKHWGGKPITEVAEAYGVRFKPEREKRAVSPQEAGRILGVDDFAVKQWIYKRKLQATKLPNGHWRIAITDLEEFTKRQTLASKPKVLVAGTDLPMMEGWAQHLEKADIDVRIGHGLPDAILKTRDNYPTLFVVDLTDWPAGWDFVERVRNSRNSRTAKVLLLSREDLSDDELGRAVEFRVQGCLNRGISLKVLGSEVAKHLNSPK